MARLTWLGLPGDASVWSALGFSVSDGALRVGAVACSTGREAAWGFDELGADPSPLGVPTSIAPAPGDRPAAHPNGVDLVDHVVYTVADLDEAVDALTAILGAEPRRRFRPRGASGPEMAFYRAGEALIEVVSDGKPPRLMGVAFMCPDLDACVAAVRERGGPIGDPKAAVQGGRIASVWKEHVGWGVAIMDRG